MRSAAPEVETSYLNTALHYLAPDNPCSCGSIKRFIKSNKCVDCNIRYCRNRRKTHPEDYLKKKNKTYKRKYGIDLGTADLLLLFQGNCCAICGTAAAGGGGGWHVDHCHEEKFVRGILCNNCNLGLGLFGDNVSFLDNAIKYLDAARN